MQSALLLLDMAMSTFRILAHWSFSDLSKYLFISYESGGSQMWRVSRCYTGLANKPDEKVLNPQCVAPRHTCLPHLVAMSVALWWEWPQAPEHICSELSDAKSEHHVSSLWHTENCCFCLSSLWLGTQWVGSNACEGRQLVSFYELDICH